MIKYIYLWLKWGIGKRSNLLKAALLRNTIGYFQKVLKKLDYTSRLDISATDVRVQKSNQWFYVLSNKFFKNSSKENEASYIPKIDNPKVVIDAGAFIGEFTCYFANAYPQAMVYVIEMSSLHCQYIEKNVKLNNLHNVKITNAALSDKVGSSSYAEKISSSALGTGDKPVATTTLKQFCADNNIEVIDFIKIDIEGSEPLLANDIDDMLSEGRIKNAFIEMGRVRDIADYQELIGVFEKHGFEVKEFWPTNYWITKKT